MKNDITLNDCQELFQKFLRYTDTAEQHEFPLLLRIHMMMEHSLQNWTEPINQKEARAMFRVVLETIGEDITSYKEENYNGT